jgi:hypothetical protein
MAPAYLPRSRQFLPTPGRAPRRRSALFLAASPLLLGLCLFLPLLLVFPRALGDGLREGEAA